jgi:hypothetical protein
MRPELRRERDVVAGAARVRADNDRHDRAGRDAVSPYQRARQDAAFLARFTQAYRGSDDPLDALWWQEHPEDVAPSGAPSVSAAAAGLRRAVYAPRSDPSASARYQRLQDRLERERAAVQEALAVAAEPVSVPPPMEQAAVAAPGSLRPSPRRARLLLTASVAAAAAFPAGVLLAPALGGGGAPEPTAPPTSSARAPSISGASGTGGALGIFGGAQREADRPAIGIGAHLLPQTFRRLRAEPTLGVDIYAAEDSDGDVCLVALTVEARLAAACAPIAAFRRAPLRLALRADRYRYETTKAGGQVELVATWGFPGRFTLDETPVTVK